MWVITGKLEFGGKYAALKGGAFGPLDQAFPVQKVVFGDGTSGDAFRWVVG